MSSEQSDGEINLIALIEDLLAAKWVISGTTVTFSVLSVALILWMPPSFNGSLRVSSLTNQQMAAYKTLNSTPGISLPIYSGEALVGQTGVILKDDLFLAFENKIRQGLPIAAAHKLHDPDIINFSGTNIELAHKLAEIGQSYTFTVNKGSKNSGVLNFKTADPELAVAIIETALINITNEIREENLLAIAALSRSIETSLKFEVEEVDLQIRIALANYKNKKIARRALLKEHAAIARQLGNADGQAIASGTNAINVAVGQDQPLYVRGYKALEKEITLLDARDTGLAASPFIEGYIELAARKQALENDTRLARIKIGLAETPLINLEAFKAVNYEIGSINFKSSTNKAFIIGLSTVFGGLVSVIFVLIRNALEARRKPASA